MIVKTILRVVSGALIMAVLVLVLVLLGKQGFFSWLDTHNGSMTALATFVLVGVTVFYAAQARLTVQEMRAQRDDMKAQIAEMQGQGQVMRNQLETLEAQRKVMTEQRDEMIAQRTEMREQRYGLNRPVLFPRLAIWVDGNAWRVSGEPWNFNDCVIRITNSGTGVATDVCGLLLPAEERPSQDRFTFWYLSPLMPGDTDIEVPLRKGNGIVDGSTKIGDYTLKPPERETRRGLWPLDVYEADARLTITYKDVFGRKHASMFDYSRNNEWVQTALLINVDHDLADLERASLGRGKTKYSDNYEV
jgi:hypothetical protein